MKYADLLGEWLVELGYTHCFFLAGGGIMHLLDGFRHRFECIPVVHEVTAGICAEHFNECAVEGQRAFALVTTGPGLTNIVTSIAGCYVEHRELLVIAGQVKSSDLLTHPERQRGVQEIDGSSICNPISLHSECLREPISRSRFRRLVKLSQGPHPGPVVLEICLDVQGASVSPETLNAGALAEPSVVVEPELNQVKEVADMLSAARRPLILFGGLVTRAASRRALPLLESLNLPVATTTSAIDRIPTGSPIFAGRPGTWGGQRWANLILAQADVVLALGAQLDLQQTGFNYTKYAPEARVLHVFPSQAELNRQGPPAHAKFCVSPDSLLDAIIDKINWKDRDGWGNYVQEVRIRVPCLEPANVCEPDFINSFEFLSTLSRATLPTDILALCSSGGTFTGALQSFDIAYGQTASVSPAHASMGYGLATAIGAAFANRHHRIVLTEGEGGFSQNLQELAIVQRHSLPIKIFIIENQGYGSIRATQKKFFNGAYLGCDPDTGLGFPRWEQLFGAYDIPCTQLKQGDISEGGLAKLLSNQSGPEAWIVSVDPNQPNWPAVSTTLSPDGALYSGPLFDMNPKLPEETLDLVGKFLPGRKRL